MTPTRSLTLALLFLIYFFSLLSRLFFHYLFGNHSMEKILKICYHFHFVVTDHLCFKRFINIYKCDRINFFSFMDKRLRKKWYLKYENIINRLAQLTAVCTKIDYEPFYLFFSSYFFFIHIAQVLNTSKTIFNNIHVPRAYQMSNRTFLVLNLIFMIRTTKNRMNQNMWRQSRYEKENDANKLEEEERF